MVFEKIEKVAKVVPLSSFANRKDLNLELERFGYGIPRYI